MSFRARLTLFFTIIVVIPMVAVALVLFSITADSETGKADARIAEGLQTALALYQDARDDARPALDRVTSDRRLEVALARGDQQRLRSRMARLIRRNRRIESIALYD